MNSGQSNHSYCADALRLDFNLLYFVAERLPAPSPLGETLEAQAAARKDSGCWIADHVQL
jgi:hypothetical protein